MLTQAELFGQVVGSRFIVHKLPCHVVQIYQAFGIGENRLRKMLGVGVKECLIFLHNSDLVVCYKTSPLAWLSGILWINRKPQWGGEERQRLIPLEDCEKP